MTRPPASPSGASRPQSASPSVRDKTGSLDFAEQLPMRNRYTVPSDACLVPLRFLKYA
jgi:hypothetical protein